MHTTTGAKLRLTVRHPTAEEIDVDAIKELVSEGIRISPHIGNLDRIEHTTPDRQLVFVGADHLYCRDENHQMHTDISLALMGLRVECVDTCSLNDRTRPDLLVRDEQEVPLVDISARDRKALVPAAVRTGSTQREDLQTVHMQALRSLASQAITRSVLYDEMGVSQGYNKSEVYQALILGFDGLVRLARNGWVQNQRVHSDTVPEHGLFGSGSEPLNGIMPPLPTMMAAEVIEAALAGRSGSHHIGGFAMPHYTKQAPLMQKVAVTAEKALRLLGLSVPRQLTYSIYNKHTGIAGLHELSSQISSAVGLTSYSQHDLHASPDLLKRARRLAN